MKPSVIWQKFYKWYCYISWALVAAVILLTIIGGHGYDIRIEAVWRVARYLSGALFLCSIFLVDLALWIISVVVWCFRRDSADGWGIFACGVVMLVVKIVNLALFVILSGA